MSKKSDLFTDNPEMFFTGSVEEFVKKLDTEWWEDKRKQLSKLSGSMETELIEFLPEDLRKKLLGHEISPEEFDEENENILYLLKTHKGKKGEGFLVQAPYTLFRKTKKNKQLGQDCKEIAINLSIEPTGSSLPNSHNPDILKNLTKNKGLGHRVMKTYGIKYSKVDTKPEVFQYKLKKYKRRVLWVIDRSAKIVKILDVVTRQTLQSRMYVK